MDHPHESTRPTLLEVEYVAEQLRLSQAEVYALLKSGELPCVRVFAPDRVLIPAAALDRYISRATD